ncbi:MAG: hypothetical protein AAB305_03635 [Candidatus Zixiibacteriota bacterium]
MKKTLTILIILVGMASCAFAQMADRATLTAINNSRPLGVKPASSPWSLLDLSKLRFSHSYSFGYYSGSRYSGSNGLLRSSLMYEFSPKLSMAMSLGVSHNPSAFVGKGSSDASLLPGFTLDYHPSSSFRMILDVQSYNGWNSPMWYNNPAMSYGATAAEKK